MTDGVKFMLRPAVPLGETAKLWLRLEQEGAPSFFLSWAWIGTWLRCLPITIEPQLLVAMRAGEPVGAAILVHRRARRRGILDIRQIHFNSTGDPAFDCITIELNDFVGATDVQREIWPEFLRWFARQSKSDELVVPGIVEGAIGGAPSDANLLFSSTKSPAFASSLLPGGTEAILSSFSRNSRQQLRRSLRACAVLGELRCKVAASVETALAWFDALKMLHVTSWNARGRQHAFGYPFWEVFHRALIARGVGERSVQLLRISAGDSPLGYLYNFRRGDTIFAYQSGFDYRRQDFRPGYISHLLAMAESAAGGAKRYDFLAGDNQLKRSLGSERYAICSHRFGKPKMSLRLEVAAKSLRDRLAL